MAYLYRKLRSPFWYIQYIDADKIKHDKSTGFRADDPNDTIKAKVLRAELEAREYVNRLRRAGVPREAAMRLVNHSSQLVHQIYQREKVDDVMQWRDAVKFPTLRTLTHSELEQRPGFVQADVFQVLQRW